MLQATSSAAQPVCRASQGCRGGSSNGYCSIHKLARVARPVVSFSAVQHSPRDADPCRGRSTAWEVEGRPIAAESKKAVVAAIVGNAIIAVIKFAAASITGSSAMLSEGIHSVVDTGNGALLYLGIRRSARPADAAHPFGHGKELYFWSLIVAISIFGIGGGMSIYEGIAHMRHPSPLENPLVNYIALAVATVVEGASFWVAVQQFRAAKGDLGTLQAVREGKDPSLFTVVFEDGAAMLGLIVAFAGVFFGHMLRNPYIDGAASVLIGLILAMVALFLAYESKGLLVGESADPKIVAGIEEIAASDAAVAGVGSVLTMHLGPQDVLLNLEVDFVDSLSAEEVRAAVDRIEATITARHPQVTRIFIEAEALRGAT